MADASEVAELWAGGELPPENDYRLVQLKTVPYQELLMGSDAFQPFKQVGLGPLCFYFCAIMLLPIMLSEFAILERDYATYMLA